MFWATSSSLVIESAEMDGPEGTDGIEGTSSEESISGYAIGAGKLNNETCIHLLTS